MKYDPVVQDAIADLAAAGVVIPPETLARLDARYGEPHRAYHVAGHISSVLADLAPLPLRMRPATLLAALWHDAVYDPRRRDNEKMSALLLQMEMSGRIGSDMAAQAHLMILATQDHRMPPMQDEDFLFDARHLVDADLAILGAAPEAFERYDRDIRFEYAHVPEELYLVGRLAVIRSFERRERLYLTEWGRDCFEAQAHANLSGLSARLERDIEAAKSAAPHGSR